MEEVCAGYGVGFRASLPWSVSIRDVDLVDPGIISHEGPRRLVSIKELIEDGLFLIWRGDSY